MAEGSQTVAQFLIRMDDNPGPPTIADWRTLEVHYAAKSTEDLLYLFSHRDFTHPKSGPMERAVIKKLLQERDVHKAVADSNSCCVVL